MVLEEFYGVIDLKDDFSAIYILFITNRAEGSVTFVCEELIVLYLLE
jgi:hypothetical protein